MKSTQIGIATVLLSFGLTLGVDASIQEVACSSSSYFSSSCTQCFNQTTDMYVGTYINGMSDIWQTNTNGSRMYLDENPDSTLVKIKHFYNNGEVFVSGEKFLYTDALSDGVLTNGEMGTDKDGRKFIDFPAKTSGSILKADPNYTIELQKVSDAIKAGGKSKPLFEFSYNLEFYNLPDLSKTIHHQECILYYPAWCGDGAKHAEESCDYAIPSGNPGYSDTCSATCTSGATACEKGTVSTSVSDPITTSTQGLCKEGVAGNFTSLVGEKTTYYSWSCGTSAVGGACSATYTKSTPAPTPSPTPAKPQTETPTQKPSVQADCTKGTLSLPLKSKITQASTGLCPSGQKVGDFSEILSSTQAQYTWSCDGSKIGGDCSGVYTLPMIVKKTSCKKGDLSLSVTQELTETTDGLCDDGDEVGDFQVNKVQDTFYYMWSCKGSLTGGECSASYTPSTPSTPTQESKPESDTLKVVDKGESCERGSISLPLSQEITRETEGLCADDEIVGNFKFTLAGNTRYYVWSCGDSLVGGACSGEYALSLEEDMVNATKLETGPKLLWFLILMLSFFGGFIVYRRKSI